MDYLTQQQQSTHFLKLSWKIHKIKHIWGHEIPLNKFKRIKIIQGLIADPVKLNSKMYAEDNWKTPKHLATKQHLSNKAWIKEGTSIEILKYF